MSDIETLWVQSDNLIEVDMSTNVATDSYINNGVVTVTLVDAVTRDEILGQTWPLTLSYVTGSDGLYRGTISNDAILSNFQSVIAKITFDGGAGLYRYWEKPCIAYIGS